MNNFLLRIKKVSINAFAGMAVGITLCSCATKDWIKAETEQKISFPAQKRLQAQMEKSALLQAETEKLMFAARLNIENIEKITSNYEKLNKDMKALIAKTDNARNNYLRHMGSLKTELSDNASALDKPNKEKTLKAAKQIAGKKIKKWLNFSNGVYSDLTLQDKNFHAESKLFDLAVRPVIKYHYLPLSNKTISLLNKSTDEIIKQQNKLLSKPGRLLKKMDLQEFLFFQGALLNCRNKAKTVNLKIALKPGASPWRDEEKFLSRNVAAGISDPLTEKAFQTMLLNRALVCDVLIRRLKFSQEKPLMLAYFINQLLMIHKFSKNSIWKTKINLLAKKYIRNFNDRTPMAVK